MALFGKKNDPVEDITLKISSETTDYIRRQEKEMLNKIILEDVKPLEIKLKDDEWIWVKGYKGTDKDMRCRGYQFDFDKQFDHNGLDPKACESGFHFCRDLKDVFSYYDVGEGNRFFEVRALVRKKDYDEYGTGGEAIYTWGGVAVPAFNNKVDKLTSKSIMFVRELTVDEVLGEKISSDALAMWTKEEKELCMREGKEAVVRSRKVTSLTALGYSGTMASYIVDKTTKFDLALALVSQDGLTMVDICHILFGKD